MGPTVTVDEPTVDEPSDVEPTVVEPTVAGMNAVAVGSVAVAAAAAGREERMVGWQSDAINGNQRQSSKALRGTPRHSEAIRGN